MAVLETEIFQFKQIRRLDKPLAWNSLGEKPKKMKERLTGRTPSQSPLITDDDWPALPRHSAASTPLHKWATAKGKKTAKITNAVKSPQTPSVQLINRFTPLAEDQRCLSDDRDSISPGWLTEQLQEAPRSPSVVRENAPPSRVRSTSVTDPDVLIVGDAALKDVKSIRNRKAKAICFPKDTISDMKDRILDLVNEHPTVKTLILHTGTCDTEENQSEILRKRFRALFDTLSSLSDIEICISGPLPPMRGTDENFSRLFSLSKWLLAACTNKNVHFIDNFSFFYDRRHLFADAKQLNKKGVKLFTQNVFHALASARTQESKTTDSDEQPLSATLEVTAVPAEAAKDGVLATEVPPPAEGGAALANGGDFKTTTDTVVPAKALSAKDENVEDSTEDDVNAEIGLMFEEESNEETFSGFPTPAVAGPNHEQSELSTDNRESTEEEESNEETLYGFPASAVAGSNHESELSTDNGESTEEEEGAGESTVEEQSSQSFSFSLSPMPLLDFTNGMNELINTGIKMTPARRPAKRPAPQPPPAKCPAPQPPSLKTDETDPAMPQKSVAWVLSPPPIPPRKKNLASQAPRPQGAGTILGQNMASQLNKATRSQRAGTALGQYMASQLNKAPRPQQAGTRLGQYMASQLNNTFSH